MAAATAAWSCGASRVQMSRLAIGRMALPPYGRNSLKGCDQFGNGAARQHGGRRARMCRPVSAGDGDVDDLAGFDLDLAVADVAGQDGESD